MAEIRKIFKSGSSLVVAIPYHYISFMSIQRNDFVWVELEDENKITIKKLAKDEQNNKKGQS